MAAATVAASHSTSPTQAAKHATVSSSQRAVIGKTKCPKCEHKVDAFAVDTNCSFRMCANLSCTWPFDSDSMAQCFEHDATVPSMRKRAKRRKALATKEEQRRAKRRQSTLDRTPLTPSSRTLSMPTIGADATATSQLGLSVTMPSTLGSIATDPLASSLPFLATPVTANSVADNNSISQLDDWLADLCNSASATGLSTSTADYSAVLSSAANSSNMLLSQGKYQQDAHQSSPANCFKSDVETSSGARAVIPSAHGPCDNSYKEAMSPDWLESLLRPSSLTTTTTPGLFVAQQQTSSQVSGCGTDRVSFTQQFSIDGALGRDCTFLPSAASNNTTCGDGGSFNVAADLFSVFGTSSSALPPASAPLMASSADARHSPSATLIDDAVIPRTSRHPSPATSNSESGADDIDAHAPLSSDELALLMGGDGASGAAKRPQQVSSSDILDPFSALLSPPSSAHLGLSDGLGKQHRANGNNSDAIADHCFWPSAASSALAAPAAIASEGVSSALSSIVPASRSASCSDAVPFDINDLFGTAATSSPNAGSSSPLSENDDSSPTTVASKPLSPLLANDTGKQSDSAVALDTASIIDNILGKSSSSSAVI